MKAYFFVFLCLSMLTSCMFSHTSWQEIDQLEKEQKYAEALEKVEILLTNARLEKNTEQWRALLIRKAALQMTLHGYEKSVLTFQNESWPKDDESQAILNLFHAHTLHNYYNAYRWEINNREKVISSQQTDIKKWTAQEIFSRIHKSYYKAYQLRKALSRLKLVDYPRSIKRNGYPDHIRSTLRDFICYSWGEFLGNTIAWTPQESREKYKLNFDNLLLFSQDINDDVLTKDNHPLIKLTHILNDLHNWHSSSKNSESALEAKLEITRRLNSIFVEKKHKEKLSNFLKKTLSNYTEFKWWTAGIYEYAFLLQNQGKIVQAHALAKEAADKYPQSIGGKKCLSFYKRIEAPNFAVQSMALDKKQARSIRIQHKNMKQLFFRAYKLELNEFLQRKHSYPGNVYTNQLRVLLDKEKPIQSWKVTLDDINDFAHHSTYVTSPLKENGFYAILASAREDFNTSTNFISGTNILISDLVIVENQKKNAWEIWVVDGNNGNGIANANVRVYEYNYNNGAKIVQKKQTSANGMVTLSPTKKQANYFVVAEKNGEISFDPNALYFYSTQENYEATGSFVYTDRSIYRPLQKLFAKVITYSGNSNTGKYKSLVNETLTITLLDPHWKEVETKTVVTNKYGTASATFTIPKGRILGSYQVRAKVRSKDSYAGVRVEEYKRPTFEVTIDKSENELTLNKKVEVQGNARYYFGLPVSSGKVFYRVTRLPQYPYWYWWYYDNVPAKSVDEITSGFTTLDNEGKFSVSFTPEADDTLIGKEKISYRFQIHAEITDEGGETRNTSSNYNIGFVGVTAKIELDDNYISVGEQKSITIHRQDLNGVARTGSGKYRLIKIKQPEKTVLPSMLPITKIPGQKYIPGDLQRPRWEYNQSLQQNLFLFEDGETISSENINHDISGKASVPLHFLPAGVYRIRYTTTDNFGSEYQTQKEFIVATDKTQLKVPIFLLAKNEKVRVGETATFFLGSGISKQPLSLEIHQNNKLLQRFWIDDAQQTQIFRLKITEQYRGGFSVKLHGVYDYKYYTVNSAIIVPWDNKKLKLSFETFRDLLRPGQKETWTVKVEGPDNQKVASEILAYMYDRSLDFFAAHNYPSLDTLYRSKYASEYTRHNLFQRSFNHIFSTNWFNVPNAPHYSSDRFILYNSYGVGGPGRSANRMMSKGMGNAEGALDDADSIAVAAPAPEAPKENKKQEVQKEVQVPKVKKANKGNEVKIRSNFAETAFFLPHIETNASGIAEIKFEIPESLTEWKVYVHAMTSDLKHMTIQKSAVTRKDLMIRPYMPRFFREGDTAVLKAVINNASLQQLKGVATLQILDTKTQQDKSSDFSLQQREISWTCNANSSTNVSWNLVAPHSLGSYSFKVIAKSANLSDGELRPVPVLPSRIHLSQSRFVVLKNNDVRIMEIDDLKNAEKDSSLVHESLIVNLNGQLIYTVLKSLPYLTEHPYECVEQTMNKFMCTSMVTSLYDSYPAIAKMAQEFSKRDSKYDPWEENDPNRKMSLAETPWLNNDGGKEDLVNILDAKIANHSRRISLEKLQKAQLNNGAFPWWSGGPGSPYMTLYLLSNFARAHEFKVDIPSQMTKKAWTYMGNHFSDYYEKRMVVEDFGYEFITFLNYVLSCYPANSYKHAFTKKQRQEMVKYSFANWTKHSPYIKAMLSLTLKRMNRSSDAKLVLESIMDSAITKQDQGTFWAPEDRGWLWYNDTIESHAFILRTLMEVKPEDTKHLDGLVLWLLLNKKMNQWKSTRATAEVIYSLVTYMKEQGSLAIREKAFVTIGKKKHSFIFEPDSYSGSQQQIEIKGKNINPTAMSRVVVEKEGKGYMFAAMNWHYSTEELPKEARGDFLSVKRKYFLRKHQGKEYVLIPLDETKQINIGDQIEVHLSIRAKHPMEFVHLQAPRGAGFEPENSKSEHHWEYGIFWYEEIRDSGANFFFENLPQGEYNFTYRIRANMSGNFRVGPATLQSMYAPEFTAFSSGKRITVK